MQRKRKNERGHKRNIVAFNLLYILRPSTEGLARTWRPVTTAGDELFMEMKKVRGFCESSLILWPFPGGYSLSRHINPASVLRRAGELRAMHRFEFATLLWRFWALLHWRTISTRLRVGFYFIIPHTKKKRKTRGITSKNIIEFDGLEQRLYLGLAYLRTEGVGTWETASASLSPQGYLKWKKPSETKHKNVRNEFSVQVLAVGCVVSDAMTPR